MEHKILWMVRPFWELSYQMVSLTIYLALSQSLCATKWKPSHFKTILIVCWKPHGNIKYNKTVWSFIVRLYSGYKYSTLKIYTSICNQINLSWLVTTVNQLLLKCLISETCNSQNTSVFTDLFLISILIQLLNNNFFISDDNKFIKKIWLI